jgi:hypothetical protein
LRVDGDAHDVISSQQPIERWHGAASENLARTCLIVERLHRGTRRGRQDKTPRGQKCIIHGRHSGTGGAEGVGYTCTVGRNGGAGRAQ